MTARRWSGLIRYHGPGGVENGREWFDMLPHAGGRTLRALCEMDELALTRDVTMALDADSRPLDAFVRITQGGVVRGATLFTCGPREVTCEGTTLELGRIVQRRALDAPLGYLGLHPLVGDALVTLCRGTDRPGEFVTVHGLTNSHSPNGELGLLAVPTHIDVAWLGPERIAVEAGTFDAQHYALRWQPHWPPADIWVHGDDALFLRLTWSLIDARYELAELRPGA